MVSTSPLHVTVTGAAGQIGYSILFRIASGQLLGEDQPVVLRLLEIEPAMKALEGVVMELDDCAFPLLHDVVATSDLKTAFDGTSWALLVGSVPRKAGMERGDLLGINGRIFRPQGRAIEEHASADVRVLVVGNPCNTNCLIARSNAPEVPADRWFAMTRLDENRAKSQLAHRAGVPVSSVTNLAIWGNHSATQYPDFANALIDGRPAAEVISDREWLEGEFLTSVQKRGAAIIEARGASSAASAANAAIDTVAGLLRATPEKDCLSVAVASSGQYGAPEGLQFGFPVRADGRGGWSVVEGFVHDAFAEEHIRVTTEELLSERAEVEAMGLLGAEEPEETGALVGVANGSGMDLPLTLTGAATALRDGSLTATDLTRAVLRRADILDGRLGAYLARFDETALEAAARADDDLRAGRDTGPLQGIPFGVKDILATKEGPTTAQSLVIDPTWGRGKDAVAVARVRAAGAVITGKLSTMEYAGGMPDPEKPFPLPRNPWDADRWPGGSSSGTGAAVAAGMVLAGFGTDTGGSIRIPAAFCGVTGLMPTYGRVPKSGCVPLGYSLDHVGPLARSARDCGAVLSVIAGFHPTDPTCVDRPVDDYVAALTGSLVGIRIGIDRVHHQAEDADPALSERLEAALTVLGELGASVVEISLPHYREGITANTVTMSAEALAYHHCDLGSKWGDYTRGFRMLAAQGSLYSAADYVQAQRVRRVIQRDLATLFGDLDAIVAPTCSVGSPRYEDVFSDDGLLGRLIGSVHTQYWDGVGNPVLAVPMGFTTESLPLSLQVAGRPFDEATILRVGDAFQQATDWHLEVPPIVRNLELASTDTN